MNTATNNQLKSATRPLSFFWALREGDGAEVFSCRCLDGSTVEMLSPDEIRTTEELIAELATLA
jgi:hypothetical protein